jgi:hypothetical protein
MRKAACTPLRVEGLLVGRRWKIGEARRWKIGEERHAVALILAITVTQPLTRTAAHPTLMSLLGCLSRPHQGTPFSVHLHPELARHALATPTVSCSRDLGSTQTRALASALPLSTRKPTTKALSELTWIRSWKSERKCSQMVRRRH